MNCSELRNIIAAPEEFTKIGNRGIRLIRWGGESPCNQRDVSHEGHCVAT